MRLGIFRCVACSLPILSALVLTVIEADSAKAWTTRSAFVRVILGDGAAPVTPPFADGRSSAPLTHQQQAPRKRALLVGINDYDYPVTQGAETASPAPGRDRTKGADLAGALNDVYAIRDVLLTMYGFKADGIEILTDSAATRNAILSRIDAFLVEPARAEDTIFFYFSGHGSKLVSKTGSEADALDETLVPYDSRLGAPDIRDKELRWRFNRILDRGASLTVTLDSCFSGSLARGPIDGVRLLKPTSTAGELLPAKLGPAPETQGALVWSAAREDEYAYETTDERGRPHGAFTLAWLRAMRDSGTWESAGYLFQRTRGRLLAEARYQEPNLDGLPEVKGRYLFDSRTDQRRGQTVVAVERLHDDGRIEIQGGWAQGLDKGSRLRLWDSRSDAASDRPPILEVNEVRGWGRSWARPLKAYSSFAAEISSGTLLEATNWVAPLGQPLKVWVPSIEDATGAEKLARELRAAVLASGWDWIDDPTVQTPTHVLSWTEGHWFLSGAGQGRSFGLSPAAREILAALTVEKRVSLFVHLPAPAALADDLDFGPGSNHTVVEPLVRPGIHHYALVGRLAQNGVEYAWLRAGMVETPTVGSAASFLPLRSQWALWNGYAHGSTGARGSADLLQGLALKLARIHSWHTLASPLGENYPYALSLRDGATGKPMGDRALRGGGRYGLALLRTGEVPAKMPRRYIYVFSIDSQGNSVLLYPDPLSLIDNRFPRQDESGIPIEVRLGTSEVFEATEPYGTDSFFLLTSSEPIQDPLGVFEFEGVQRGPPPTTAGPLERLLYQASASRRGGSRVVPRHWSIEYFRHKVVVPDRSRPPTSDLPHAGRVGVEPNPSQ